MAGALGLGANVVVGRVGAGVAGVFSSSTVVGSSEVPSVESGSFVGLSLS